MVSRSRNISEKFTCGFTSALSSAVSEWFLIILLYLNGLFSYLVTKFADHCKLQTPCLFCSRLDHILGSERPGFYKKLLCHSHKLEVSSSSYCYIHCKLADIREMCDTCMLSFATEKATCSAAYKSQLTKLEINLGPSEISRQKSSEITKDSRLQSKSEEKDAARVPLRSDPALGFLRTRQCSCCNVQFRMKSHAHRLLQAKSIIPEVIESTGAMLGLNRHTVHRSQDVLNARKEVNRRSNGSPEGNHGFDRMSHVGYTELKINSDTESEIPVSDDDHRNSLLRASSDAQNKLPQYLAPSGFTATGLISKPHPGDLQEEKLIHTAPTVTTSIDIIQDKKISPSELSDIASTSETGPANGLKELNWTEAQERHIPAQTGIESHVVPPEATVDSVQCISSCANDETSKILGSAETSFKPVRTNSNTVLTISSIMELNDAYKLVFSGKLSDPSPLPSPRISLRANEELRRLLSNLSAAQGTERPGNDMTPSPRMIGTGEDFQNPTKKNSIERNGSGLDSSVDGSIDGEPVGEDPVEDLKSQVNMERQAFLLLYQELEEERSASAIAANQAMAMITRLQEEKAAMQMEALQYQRMMEEQAEYDQEVLQKATDLLAERERELQDLEAELIAYRRRFLDEYKDKEMPSLDEIDEREADHNSNPNDAESFGSGERRHVKKNSLFNFEDEKTYIFNCLKRLENKYHLAHNDGFISDTRKHNAEQMRQDNVTANGQPNDTDKLLERNANEIPENSSIRGHTSSGQQSHYHAKEYPLSKSRRMTRSTSMRTYNERFSFANSNNDKRHRFATGGDHDVADIETELSLLCERLEALEADRSFLEHTINSLKNGDEGLHFVQEIASHLQELRKAVLGRGRTEQLKT